MNGTMRLRPGLQRAREAAEALDRVVVALRHGLDPGEQHQDDHDDDRDDDQIETEYIDVLPS